MKPSQCRGIWESPLKINVSIMLIYEIKTKEPLLCAITRLIYRKCKCVCVRGREEAASLHRQLLTEFQAVNILNNRKLLSFLSLLNMKLPCGCSRRLQGSTFLLIFSVNVNDSQFGKKKGKISAHKREAVTAKCLKK